MANTPAGISVKALAWSWWRRGQTQRHENNKEAHVEQSQTCQLRDIVGHGDKSSIVQLRLTGDA